MATVDRIERFPSWTPSATGVATEDEDYTGRHRKPGSSRGFSLRALFYTARHRKLI